MTQHAILTGTIGRIGFNHRMMGTLAALLISFFVQTVTAETRYAAIEDIRQNVQQHLERYFQQRYPQLRVGESLKVKTGKLDQRLRLVDCTLPLEMEIRDLPQSANVTVKTRCNGVAKWTIYVPATLEIWRPVIVASRSLARGTQISADDITLKTLNTARLTGGYVSELTRIEGLELKRPLRALEVIKLSNVKQPNLVHKGDTVVLQVKSTALTVETEGTALSNGVIGAQIRVRNEHSRRIVNGRVVGPGQVSVAIR